MIERHPSPHRDPATRWLLAFVVAYGILHHQGFLFSGLGMVPGVADGGTRWADWLDLATPPLVLGPAAMVVASSGARSVRSWSVLVAGGLLYVEGHGIHLAANSIANDEVVTGSGPSEVVHLWDEVVGHYLWVGGTALVMVAMVVALHRHPSVPGGVTAGALAVVTGLTWTTNGLEGGTAVLSLAIAAGFTAWAARARARDRARVGDRARGPDGDRDRCGERSPVPDLVLAVFAPAVVLLVGYGLLHRGFPQPSEIGWVVGP